MCLEGGDGQYCLRVIQSHAPHVERTSVAFTQEINFRAVVRQDWITVLTSTVGQVSVAARGGVIAPDVARDGRRVVLAPFVFETLAILVEEGTQAVVQKTNHFSRCAQYLLCPSACNRHGIELRHGRGGEKSARGGILQGSVEIDLLTIRRKSRGHFGSRVIGEASRASAIGGHHIDVHIAFTVAGESYLTAVG